MTNILNPKPRFGYNPDTDLIYDYALQRDVPPLDKPYDAVDGTWNLAFVKKAILSGESIETAHLSVRRAGPPVQGRAGAQPPRPGQPARSALPGGLTAEQLQGLKFSAVQLAALNISPAQVNTTGVTAAQVQNWGLNALRADSLKLTPEQRAVLLP